VAESAGVVFPGFVTETTCALAPTVTIISNASNHRINSAALGCCLVFVIPVPLAVPAVFAIVVVV
jgi:hypothetical protein